MYATNWSETAQSYKVAWMAIGSIQLQWGYLVTNSSHVYITFPIAISKTFAVISGTDHSGSPNAANTFYSVSNVGMYIGSAIAVGKSWIVLGVS